MTSAELIHYETWDLQAPPLPPRSRLYPLEPVGIGTPAVESLTSYIARLAEAHRVLTGKLVLGEILPFFGRPYLPGNMSAFWTKIAQALNGTAASASDMVHLLQKLTTVPDLCCLTLLPWAEVLSPTALLRPHRAWCPLCLATYHQAGQIVYEPLMWTLRVVTLCPVHERPLSLTCPHCQKTLPWLGYRMRPGWCSHCRCWLGRASAAADTPPPAISGPELAWQQWLTHAVGQLLASPPTLSLWPNKDQLATNLAHYVATIAQGNVTGFAQKLQAHHLVIDPPNLYGWLNRLLQLCYCLGTSPLSLLTRQVCLDPPNQLNTLPFPGLQKRLRKPTNRLTTDQLQHRLQEILASDEDPPPSLSRVAKRLGFGDQTQLSQRLPALSRQISNRYRAYRKLKSQQRQQQVFAEVRQVVSQLYHQGHYPGLYLVSTHLSKPGYVRVPAVIEVWRSALQALGLSP
jgi:hypothetical protein